MMEVGCRKSPRCPVCAADQSGCVVLLAVQSRCRFQQSHGLGVEAGGVGREAVLVNRESQPVFVEERTRSDVRKLHPDDTVALLFEPQHVHGFPAHGYEHALA